MRIMLVFSFLILIGGCADPIPPPLPELQEQPISYPVGKDTGRAIVYRPVGEAKLPAVIVVHEDYGLTDWVKDQARRLAQQGYVVLAVDLYRGQVVTNLLDAHIMDRGLTEHQVVADLKAAVDYLANRPDVRVDSIGIIGWDSGGGYALDAALHDGRLRTVVVCYGRLATDPKTLAPLQGSVLGIFAGLDEGITADTIDQFRQAMQQAGKRLPDLHVYPDCGRGFMNPANWPASQSHDEDVADAWQKIDSHLASELGQSGRQEPVTD